MGIEFTSKETWKVMSGVRLRIKKKYYPNRPPIQERKKEHEKGKSLMHAGIKAMTELSMIVSAYNATLRKERENG